MANEPGGPGDPIWTATVGPGGTIYTVQYKAGNDDLQFNFENDNSSIDLPIYLLWGTNAQNLNQAKLDILGYPLVVAGAAGGQYISRITPMTALPFTQLSNGRPYLFAVSMSGTGWGVPPGGIVKNPTLNFPIYYQTKARVHFETLTYDILTDAQMIAFGLVDANGNPDEATLARYVTREMSPGTEYLTLPQGGFQFVNTGTSPVAGTAGKLTPNYDISLTWELVPQSCVGTVLYNPGLTNPPIDNCLGHVNNAGFPPVPFTGQQGLSTAVPSSQGTGYQVGDILILQGGFAGSFASVVVATVGAAGAVTGVNGLSTGNYFTPPANPVATLTTGEGTGCTLTCAFVGIDLQQLMTAYPAAAGTGYALGDLLTLSGGTFGTAATARVVALGSAGATGPVLAVDIIQRGNYQVNGVPSPPANPVSTTGGKGTGCTLTCEFGNGIPPGQLLMTAATIQPIRSSAGDRLFRLAYRFKYLPQGVQRLYYQGNANHISGPTVAVSTVGNTINPLITTGAAHGFSAGMTVVFVGTGTALDGKTFQVATVPLATTFTVFSPAPGAGTGGTVGLSGAYQDAGYFEVTTNGFTNTGLNLYNNDPKTPPVNIYPWNDFRLLFRVPS